MTNTNTQHRRFPHLLPQDAEVWKRFLTEHEHAYNYFEYDLRVGLGRDPGETFNANIRGMAIQLSQRRIDAVGFQTDIITIFEITTSAGLTALGQLQAYPLLYRRSFPTNSKIQILLIAEHLQDDIEHVLLDASIPFLLFPST